jgi:uncharacterized protein with von Willebrand factor type A (vWA) domain
MLINFFHSLRDVGIPVTTRELLDLYEGLSRHVAFGSADEFYFFSRTCLVKDEKYFDRFDKAFGAHFEELQDLDDIIEAMIPMIGCAVNLPGSCRTRTRPRSNPSAAWRS